MQLNHIAEAYHACSDFPLQQNTPRLTYMLATSPRSGSTYLAFELWRTGILGAPMEYLGLPHPSGIFERLGNSCPERYWRELQRFRTSPNGVFGYKMFLNNYTRLAHLFPEMFSKLSADKVIHLDRRDKVGQAVSHAAATLSGEWFHEGRTNRRDEINYDFSLIDRFYEESVRQSTGWFNIFKSRECDLLEVFYEDIVRDRQSIIDAVISFFGLSHHDVRPIQGLLTLRKQSTDMNVEWAERYISDRKKAGKPIPRYRCA